MCFAFTYRDEASVLYIMSMCIFVCLRDFEATFGIGDSTIRNKNGNSIRESNLLYLKDLFKAYTHFC